MSRCLKHANRKTYDAANAAIRTGQCVLAILVAALSGVDLGRWSRSGRHADSRWIYAQVVSVLSTLTALACGFRQRRAPPSTASLVVCVLCQALLSLIWVVASAVYGQLVVASEAAATELDFTRSAVKMAVAASGISAVLWFVDAVAACACRKGSEAQKADAEEQQGGQGLEGNSGVGVGLQGTGTKGAQEMKDQRSDALPAYSEVESTVEFGKNLPRDPRPNVSLNAPQCVEIVITGRTMAYEMQATSCARAPTNVVKRARRRHTKSRDGCQTCKARKVKCDEESSGCGNCVQFGVPCDFLPLLERKRWATTTATASSTTTRQQQVTKRRRGRPRADWSGWALRLHDEALSSSSSSSSSFSSSSSSSSNQLQTRPSQPASLYTQPNLQLAELGIDDLALLHHYHTVTAPTLGDARLWRDAAPRLGREHPCIFHIMLSISAYHVVRLRGPATTTTTTTSAADCRLRLAEHHYEAAVRLAVPMLPRLDVGNCQALYIVTVLICFTAFARGPSSEGDLLLVAQQQGLVPWMSLLRGVRFVIETVGSSTVFSGFLTPVPETTPDEASCRGGGACRSGCGGVSARRAWNWRETLGRIQDVAAKRKIGSDANDAAAAAKMYERAIESLTRCFETTFGEEEEEEEEKEDAAVPKKCTHGQVHVVMAWAYTLDPDFVAKLAERDHVSLVLLGHFAILVQTLGRYWFIEGWGEHILRQVRQILGEDWNDLLP
ncbi:hypothetical protein MY3296_006609 [Beauveria thailandica]